MELSWRFFFFLFSMFITILYRTYRVLHADLYLPCCFTGLVHLLGLLVIKSVSPADTDVSASPLFIILSDLMTSYFAQVSIIGCRSSSISFLTPILFNYFSVLGPRTSPHCKNMGKILPVCTQPTAEITPAPKLHCSGRKYLDWIFIPLLSILGHLSLVQ